MTQNVESVEAAVSMPHGEQEYGGEVELETEPEGQEHESPVESFTDPLGQLEQESDVESKNDVDPQTLDREIPLQCNAERTAKATKSTIRFIFLLLDFALFSFSFSFSLRGFVVKFQVHLHEVAALVVTEVSQTVESQEVVGVAGTLESLVGVAGTWRGSANVGEVT